MNIPLLSRIFNMKNRVAPSPYDSGHDSRAIANIFIQKYWQDKREIEVMAMSKIIYIAHGWKLGYTGKPLISDRVTADLYGPSVPQAHDALREGIIISDLAKNKKGEIFTTELREDEQQIIDSVYKNYSVLSFDGLISITANAEDRPWGDAYLKEPCGTISNHAIQRYYEGCVSRQQQRNAS